MKLSKFKRILLVLALVVLVCASFKMVSLIREKQALNVKKSLEIEDIRSDIEEEGDMDNELDKASDKDDSDEDYEALARKELGLIKKDEIVIKPK